jgi:lysophospholipid acyltransferase (LPLAT)-like uncharacterized protein
MTDEVAEPPAAAQPERRSPVRRTFKELWRKIRGPIARSRFFKSTVAAAVAGGVRTVYRWNRFAEGSMSYDTAIAGKEPVIIALWHGQHLLTPCFYPRGRRLVAMFSRSADAELNALVFEKLGFSTVRGSGGRPGEQNADKGGARALIALKRILDAGDNVAMIADIAHGTPRSAGLGIVLLARISGRPVVPVATTTSRRKVIEKSWDKTTINLPFGRSAIIIGDPVWVPADAGEEELEAKRIEVTQALNAVTERAYRLVDGGA